METTPEQVQTNIRSVLQTFENLHRLLESDSAFSHLYKEDVTNYFKLAIFIERAIANFQKKNCIESFFDVLKSHLQDSFGAKMQNVDFYKHACDHVIFKFFTQKSDLIDVALSMYTQLLPKERFEDMLTDFIVTSASCKTIFDYAIENKTKINKVDLQAQILLQSWANQLETSKNNEIQESINNMLSAYKIRNSLALLLKVLIVENTTENDNKIKQIIFDLLLKKMTDRSILSKAFWLCLFKEVKNQDVAKICALNQEFLLHLSRFIVYLGSMMVKTENAWCGDPSLSICPEITFSEMLVLIRNLKDHNESVKKYLHKVFRDANANTGLPIWDEFESKYIHEFL